MTLLVVSAESYELAPIRQQCRWMRRTSFGFSADWREYRLVAACGGPGPDLAVEAMTAAMKNIRPDALISAGVCGGLEPGLRIADVFVGREVSFRGRSFSCTQPRTLKRFISGVLICHDRVVVTAEEKGRLAGEGFAAVDMESGPVAARAAHDGLPFYCIRAVSDLADENLAIDFNDMRDSAGRFSNARIVRAALANPFQLAPALARIRRNTRLAANALGDFLANCRF